jgi:chemotaxis protein methyltransferase CheR
LIGRVAVAFTYFFRDYHTLKHIVAQVVPIVSGRSSARVWDAGCAHGPEPYSLAIEFAERMGGFAFKNLRIDATDIDGSNLFGEIIREGVYGFEELQRIPEELFRKHFSPGSKDGTFRISDAIRSRIRFRKHDLLSSEAVGDEYSLILCKNVLLHFQPRERVEVVRMFHRSLTNGGIFATEQTQKLPEELSPLFEQVTPDAQVYRKRSG